MARHSRDDGWQALAAKEPIAFDIILVCRKRPFAADTNPKRQRGTESNPTRQRRSTAAAPPSARSKIDPLLAAGFALPRNDRKIILYGHLLTTLATAPDAAGFRVILGAQLAYDECRLAVTSNRSEQQTLFERA